ncbi:DUF7342 family protein [Haloarcula onubensis]|uniref:Sugar-specific transcriptional regulator TrmB n=1 Tax=Haloarcula onubensis TaxID=2950539 RepID=A0ABU2FSZ3_9EURY|nr:hypothetical protein [Halomicroarcula sp. S3CR25-11]MDS0283884.1 hypothetical protein [Halomicroarcula sp. S3CR25-11]
MDLTDIPGDVTEDDEARPDFDAWESPDEVLREGPTRERIFDVIVQLREPTEVSVIAARADCGTEIARDYLEWFAEMGIVRELSGQPVRYERNDSYLQWRRIEQIRQSYSETEIVAHLTETLDAVTEYRERFDTDSPSDVSPVAESIEASVEDVWEALSEWKALEQRAALLDSARHR